MHRPGVITIEIASEGGDAIGNVIEITGRERRKKMAKEVGSGGVAKEDEDRSTEKGVGEACWVSR